jgi:hypothetical protein
MATTIPRGQVKGVDILEITLSPTSVQPSSGNEQTFTVQGLKLHDFVYVNKPTNQNGLVIANARVSAANTLAIAFANSSAATITPTAAEVYTLWRGSPENIPVPSALS